MKTAFFEICAGCKKTFNNQQEYFAHIAEHKGSGNKKTEKSKDTKSMKQEKDSAKVAEILFKRKKLIKCGIEAATMTAEEVESRYDIEFGKEETK